MITLKDLPELADRLIYIRRTMGLTQADLSAMAGTSQQAIQQAESGLARNPRYLPKLAIALGISVEWLTLNEQPQTTSPRRGLSEKDDQVLGAFKSLSKKDQELIFELMKSRTKK